MFDGGWGYNAQQQTLSWLLPKVCEDLSSFFEIAGGFYFDPQPGSDIAAGADVGIRIQLRYQVTLAKKR
jgi:hypothetical protein